MIILIRLTWYVQKPPYPPSLCLTILKTHKIEKSTRFVRFDFDGNKPFFGCADRVPFLWEFDIFTTSFCANSKFYIYIYFKQDIGSGTVNSRSTCPPVDPTSDIVITPPARIFLFLFNKYFPPLILFFFWNMIFLLHVNKLIIKLFVELNNFDVWPIYYDLISLTTYASKIIIIQNSQIAKLSCHYNFKLSIIKIRSLNFYKC